MLACPLQEKYEVFQRKKNNHQLDLKLLHLQRWYKKQWFPLGLSKMKVKNIFSAYFLKEAHYTQPGVKTILLFKVNPNCCKS